MQRYKYSNNHLTFLQLFAENVSLIGVFCQFTAIFRFYTLYIWAFSEWVNFYNRYVYVALKRYKQDRITCFVSTIFYTFAKCLMR